MKKTIYKILMNDNFEREHSVIGVYERFEDAEKALENHYKTAFDFVLSKATERFQKAIRKGEKFDISDAIERTDFYHSKEEKVFSGCDTEFLIITTKIGDWARLSNLKWDVRLEVCYFEQEYIEWEYVPINEDLILKHMNINEDELK